MGIFEESDGFMQPYKIIGIGLNYKGLGIEEQEPIIFMKSPSSIIYNNENIKIPYECKRVWAEVELVMVMGKNNKIKGYTIANDVTADNVYKRDHHLAKSKCINTFCPIDPLVRMLDVSDLSMKTYVNEKLTQEGNTSDMLYSCEELVGLISKYITLEENDLILTGTPKGAENNIIKSGDTVKVCIEGLGELENKVV